MTDDEILTILDQNEVTAHGYIHLIAEFVRYISKEDPYEVEHLRLCHICHKLLVGDSYHEVTDYQVADSDLLSEDDIGCYDAECCPVCNRTSHDNTQNG